MVMGLAASLFHGIAASPSFYLFSFGARAVATYPHAEGNRKKRSHTMPTLIWAMADCAFSRQRKAVYQYQRPSVVNSLLHAESDIKPSSLSLGVKPKLCLWTLSIVFCFPLAVVSA